MTDEELKLLLDLHLDAHRQGPGDDAATRRAIDLAGLNERSQTSPPLQIADIGCGTGASTRVLAAQLQAQITAVDFLPPFLQRLEQQATQDGLGVQISTLVASMEALPFADAALDVIWAEGAIYNIGFTRGLQQWHRFLKPGGILAVSELTWLTKERPAELTDHWLGEYPEVATAATKMALLEQHGYSPIGYFVLPERCWLDAYYRPMQQRFAAFLQRHDNSAAACAIVAAEEAEIALYERYKSFVSYGFYIARKV